MNTYSGPTKLARALKAIQAIMLTLTLVTMSFPVSAFAKKDDEENGHTPVTVCHNGSALTVDDDAVSGHVGHGDTVLHSGEKQDGDDELCSDDEEEDEDNDEDDNDEDEDSGDDEDNDDDEDNEDEDEGDDEDTDEDAVSCTLSAVPSSITVGGNSTLTLSIEGEDADELSAEVDQEVGQLSDGDTAVVTPTETTTYTATISGDHEDDDKKKNDEDEDDDDEDWTATCSVTVTVNPVDDEDDTDDGAQCVIVSDTVTMQGEVPVALVTFIHGAWNTVTAALNPAKWIWGEDPVSPANTEKTETFTRTFSLVTAPTSATLEMSADNGYIVTVNGEEVDDKSGVETNYSSVHSYEVGDLLVEGENTIEFTVTNFAQSGGTPTSNPAGLIYKLSVADADCGDPEVDHITVVASKVVCADEADLPNWGNGGEPITSTTAADWVETHESCRLEDGWKFEYGNSGTPDGGNATLGHVAGYTEFGPTVDGVVTANIPMSALGDGSEFHLREQLQDGYIPFTYNNNSEAPNGDNVSAEFYCANDVLNYDNYDFIRNPVEGNTYYCVAFNAEKEKTPACNPEINLLKNGGFEMPDIGTGSFSIVKDINLDAGSVLEWLVAWTSPQDGGRLGLEIQDHIAGNPAVGSGDQFAELDGDHPVTISQTVATVPGQQYELSFKYSPRAGRTAADNQITVKADGSVLGAVLSADGNTDGTTNWNDYFRTFTAADASTLIEFADTGTDTSYGGYLDDVSLHCVVPVEDTTVTVTKVVVGNENYDASDFPLFVGEEGVVSGVATEVKPGTYTVYESSNADFTPSFSGDCVADEDNEARQNLVEDFIAKKNAIQDSIDASPEDPDNAAKQALIEDIDAKIVALQNSLSATITVEEGEDAQCTITNTYNPKNSEEGTLVIVKETTGGNGAFDFDITGNEASIDADVETEDGTGSTEVSLLEGTYNLTETVLSGWTLDNVSCEYGEESAGESIPNGEQIYIEAGETVTCTFHNTKVAESSRRGGRRHGGGGGEVLGASTCGPLLTSYLKLGWANDADQVSKLQDFLNTNMNAGLPVSGFFGPMTFEAVKAFQKAHWEDVLKPWIGLPGSGIEGENTPTGFVYQTTRWQINNIFCPGSEAFPAKLD